ncbi:MAG TPA: cupin domain-containing protein [Mucilaginibacter sp.]|nr:cupin domain-containing protein [Mucilaginibacter sp.]
MVVNGTGEFMNGGKLSAFKPGDVLFAPAGIEHRFINFTDDFVTWVIFYGPQGGEK